MGTGRTTLEAVGREIERRSEGGELIPITREHQPRQATTRRTLEMEEANIQTIAGRKRHLGGNNER